MPIIKDRETIKVKIDATAEGGEVEVLTSLRAREIEAIQARGGERASIGTTLAVLIQSWNLTDESGKPLPIDEKTTLDIEIGDANRIAEASGIEGYIKGLGKAPAPQSGQKL